MKKQETAIMRHRTPGSGSGPSCQIVDGGQGPNGGSVAKKDGRANTNAGGADQQMKPWFQTDANGRTVDWRAGQ